ncbi:hydantoinase/oxoprolinase family protein [Methylobacterium sp. J-077]|uniref:hydantoinase/oxoprolinase family protein n=1 Tax=Methylobacterium sp. J-077 TaxID=2836656 RepID=UPI001FB93EB4|nr:hydantoinase/oxoprolinase family protein [Methylobacterium sp. J-077]MCJ2121193.1 hydantoinase/oxoprolinase family protein [Methylobacterium sp. J-077]
MKQRTRVCTDVGGTFTDLVYFETDAGGQQTVRTAKADTTPPNYEEGILEVLRRGAVDIENIGFFAHGTTVVINSLTERRGAKTGLITTEGFRDVIEIARGARPDFYNLKFRKPAPFVPRYLRKELPERVDARGEVLKEPDLTNLPAILDVFKAEGVEAIAVSFLHAYANPLHEQQVVDAISSLWPEVSVVGSHQITREWREYERTNTAVMSAFVQPVAARYLSRLEQKLRSQDYSGPIYVMQSNCGVDTLAHAKETPITMVESGPASGMWGAAALGQLVGESNVIALDIGGTTAKCSLIEDGKVQIKTDYYIERDRTSPGYPIMVPVVDLVEIGNGGGSIAWVDEFERLHVGPQSAGASPGPAAYGRGGRKATTTDANLMLGRINPQYFCGGTMEADMRAVEAALQELTQQLDLPAVEIAKGIIQIADSNMVNALKLVSINRGFDPRDFTLIAFGGGGGMHAVSLAQELGVKKVIIPKAAGVFSAWGMMMSDLRRDQFLTKLLMLKDADAVVQAQTLLNELVDKSRTEYISEGIRETDIRIVSSIKLRYQNQEHAVEVELQDGELLTDSANVIGERFHEQYERQYTYRLDAPIELVGFHVVAFARVGTLEILREECTASDASSAQKGTRNVNYAASGIHRAHIYDSTKLKPGMSFNGPAIIEDPGTTIVVFPANTVSVDGYGNICITDLQLGDSHA